MRIIRMDGVRMKGQWVATCLQRGEHMWSQIIDNDITTEGLTEILSDFFNAGTQKTAWYIGLINETNYTAIAAADTMGSHSGWTELQNYAESVRPQWTNLAVASGIIGNQTPALFTINTLSNVKGIFLASNNTKGGTTGKLWCRGIFPITRTLAVDQVLMVSYSVRAAGG